MFKTYYKLPYSASLTFAKELLEIIPPEPLAQRHSHSLPSLGETRSTQPAPTKQKEQSSSKKSKPETQPPKTNPHTEKSPTGRAAQTPAPKALTGETQTSPHNQTTQYLRPDPEKGTLEITDHAGRKHYELRLPLICPPWQPPQSPGDYLESLQEEPNPYLTILITAGHSTMGYYEEGSLTFHKVIKKYMVRAKQGKAQIGYLNTRGKSKAGSRVRLANTISFFEDINSKITEWDIMDECERILYACPIRLWTMVFESKVPAPFQKDDPRLRKIPRDIRQPNLKELERVNQYATAGFVNVYDEDHFPWHDRIETLQLEHED